MKALMWLMAIGYPAGLAAALYVMTNRDPFSIFNEYYMLATLVLIPALLLTLTVIVGRSDQSPGWTWVGTLGLWIVMVTGAHLYIIGALARSV